jgi:hypothetical protein
VWSVSALLIAVLAATYATLGTTFFVLAETFGLLNDSGRPELNALDWIGAGLVSASPSLLLAVGLTLWRRGLRWLWVGLIPLVLVAAFVLLTVWRP